MAAAIASSTRYDSVAALCAALGAQLRVRAGVLAQEVRDYPTPIAACDEQLTDLLERRSRVLQARNHLDALGADGGIEELAGTLATLEACAGALRAGDLDAGVASELKRALAALRNWWRARAGGCGPADTWANDGARA